MIKTLHQDGFSPGVGLLVGALSAARETTVERVRDLTIEQLDRSVDPNLNTIGMLLSHIVALEMKYYARIFEDRSLTPQEDAFWGAGLQMWDRARHLMRGYPVSFYLDQMALVRARTIDALRLVDDAWMRKSFVPAPGTVWDNGFALFHVAKDELGHRGQIVWLRRMQGIDERQSFNIADTSGQASGAHVAESAVVSPPRDRGVATKGNEPRSTPNVPIGLLELGVMTPGEVPPSVVTSTVQLAETADRLGYDRFWLAEHHAGAYAWGDPTPLLALIASRTDRIRVGTGGSLAKMSRPAEVARDLALLSRLFPGRIDLGVAPGAPTLDLGHLEGSPYPSTLATDEYVGRVAEVCRRVRPTMISPGTSDELLTVPQIEIAPEIWVLGGQEQGAQLARRAHTGFVCCLFQGELEWSDVESPGALQQLHRTFGRRHGGAGFGVAVAGLCARSDRLVRKRLDGRLLTSTVRPSVIGPPAQCADRLSALVRSAQPDFVLFLDVTRGADERLDSIDALASVAITVGPK